MSGISFQELILLLVIGLIVLGPERLPRVANQLGRWLGQARRMTRSMKRQLEDELDLGQSFEILPPDRTRHTPTQGYVPPGAAAAPPMIDSSDTTPAAQGADNNAGDDAPPATADAEDAAAGAADKDGEERA